ncbi:MAG: hypothetical protein V1664_04010 [Candidatus Uhrbacteria bacterium]
MRKVVLVITATAISLITLAVVFVIWFSGQNNNSATVMSSCGDNVCDKIELKRKSCDIDCQAGSTNVTPISNSNSSIPTAMVETPANPNVVYLGMMVHLEKVNDELVNETSFRNHAAAVRKMAQIFLNHNAKATFESGSRFTQACRKWDDNVLRELYDQGQGIGLHADLGGKDDGTTQAEFTQAMSQMKTELEQELSSPIEHVSGICSAQLDWVKGAIDAGFKFTTGAVGFCAMTLPYEERPTEYQNCVVPTDCHGEMPLAIKDRVHPWLTSSSSSWLTPDSNGQLAIFPAGNIWKSFSLESENVDKVNFGSGFDSKDIDIYFLKLDEVLKYATIDQTNIFYVGWSIGTDENINEELFSQFFVRLQPYIDAGQVQWATFSEMYDRFMEKGS